MQGIIQRCGLWVQFGPFRDADSPPAISIDFVSELSRARMTRALRAERSALAKLFQMFQPVCFRGETARLLYRSYYSHRHSTSSLSVSSDVRPLDTKSEATSRQ